MATVKAILREPVKNLGKVGEVVHIKRGFFRYLETLGKVCYASPEAISRLEHEREQLYQKNEERRVQAQHWADQMTNFSLELVREAGENGILYGSVTSRDIAKELNEHNIDLHPNQIILSAPIKEGGEYTVTLELHPQVVLSIPLIVRAHNKA